MRRARKLVGLVALISTPAFAEPVTIAALGDSLTQGYGLAVEDGLVPQLQTWLGARGQSVSILNAGVSGDTTAGGLARLEWTLTPEVDALIVALGGNDLLRGIDPAVSRANLNEIVAAARQRNIEVLLVGLSAPSNYGPSYKTSFDSIFPALADEHDTLLYPDLLAPLTAGGTRAEALARYMQPDGIHPNAEGVKVIVAAIGPKIIELIDRAGP